MKFSGKKLLMLGSNVGSTDIIRYAKENGAYTYAADYLPKENSPSKQCADSIFHIDTADITALSQLIKQEKIDAVMSGISEFNILKAMDLSMIFGLPYYCTRQQWERIEHKDQFRNLCVQYGVPCPETYYAGSGTAGIPWDMLSYPAVLKPVDSGASSGVHICTSRADIETNIPDALHFSSQKRIIIEEFIHGDEFTAHYSIRNGRAALSCMDNRYAVAIHHGNVTTIPAARIYPSSFLNAYIEKVNPYMIALVEGIGLSDGVIFVQGIYTPDTDDFRIFEAGCRSAAEAPYRILEKITGNNYIKLMVDCALGAEPDFTLTREDPYMNGKCCGIMSFIAKGGTVGSIKGLQEAVKNTPSVIEYENRYPVGSVTPDGDTLRQLMIRFVMICSSREQMRQDIAYLNRHIHVNNSRGEDMVIKFDPARF